VRALVTGVCGFIGSTLAERLLVEGHQVVGVDSFTGYYPRAVKEENVASLLERPGFGLIEADLADVALGPLLDGIDTVFHLAGQPGVRASWGSEFANYLDWNVGATQRLLEACRDRPLDRFVYSSSSSVYGNATSFPTNEDDRPQPFSPYGVTKLAGEHLCTLYGTNFGVPTVSLRYFTVYGPKQRPDMAMHKLFEAAIAGASFPMNGDGSQIRDFTFVDDVVQANVLAAGVPCAPGRVYNVGGGSKTSLAEVIELVERFLERPVRIERVGDAAGDPARTGADTSRIQDELGWTPRVSIEIGLRRQADWHRARHGC